MIKKYLFLFLILIIWVVEANAQKGLLQDKEFSPLLQKCLAQVYNSDFSGALTTMQPVRAVYPDHPIVQIFDCLYIYWKNYPISSFPKELESYKEKLKRALKKSEVLMASDKKNSENKFYYMLINMMLAKQGFDDGNTFYAASCAFAALPIIKQGFLLQTSFPDFYFTTGLYKYYRELLADNYPVYSKLASIFSFPRGDKITGLANLDKASALAILVKPDALMWASTINLRYENNKEKGLLNAQILSQTYPANPFFKLIYIENLLQSGHYPEAEKNLTTISPGNNNYCKLSVALFKGMLCEQRTNLVEAENYYNTVLRLGGKPNMVNENYIGLAHFYLGRIFLSKRQPALAKEHFKKAYKHCDYAIVKKETKNY